jgi:hypothetical protein
MQPDEYNNVRPGDHIRYHVTGETDNHTGTLQDFVFGRDGSVMGYAILEDSRPDDPHLTHITLWHIMSLGSIARI